MKFRPSLIVEKALFENQSQMSFVIYPPMSLPGLSLDLKVGAWL